MLELLWIKSLFDFAALCLGGLFVPYLKTRYPQPSRLVKRVIILLSCKIMIDLVGFLQYTSWLRELLGISGRLTDCSLILQFCFAPILFFCCRTVHSNKAYLKASDWWHVLPAVFYMFGLIICPNKLDGISSFTLLVVELHFMIYGLLSLRLLEGGTRLIVLLRLVLIGLLVWRLLRLVEYLLWLHLHWIEEPAAWGLYILSELIFLWTLGYFFFKVIQQPSLLQEGKQWLLSTSDKQRIEEGLRNLAEREKIYLDPLLSLDRLAKALLVPSHYLSQYLNRDLKMTFNEWVNSHRIEECKCLITDPKLQDRTIQSLMYQVGFNSKSTFHTAFKKNTGMTPTQYRKAMPLAKR